LEITAEGENFPSAVFWKRQTGMIKKRAQDFVARERGDFKQSVEIYKSRKINQCIFKEKARKCKGGGVQK